jgi:hypothetical protein
MRSLTSCAGQVLLSRPCLPFTRYAEYSYFANAVRTSAPIGAVNSFCVLAAISDRKQAALAAHTWTGVHTFENLLALPGGAFPAEFGVERG